jgi:hypothetical protein
MSPHAMLITFTPPTTKIASSPQNREVRAWEDIIAFNTTVYVRIRRKGVVVNMTRSNDGDRFLTFLSIQ